MLLTFSCMHQPTRAFRRLILWFLIVVVTPPSLLEAASGWFIHRWFLSFSYVLISVCTHLLWSALMMLCFFWGGGVCPKINKIIFPDYLSMSAGEPDAFCWFWTVACCLFLFKQLRKKLFEYDALSNSEWISQNTSMSL